MAKGNAQNQMDSMDKPLPLWVTILLPFYGGEFFIVADIPHRQRLEMA